MLCGIFFQVDLNPHHAYLTPLHPPPRPGANAGEDAPVAGVANVPRAPVAVA